MDEQTIYTRITPILRTLFDEYEGPVGPTLNAKQVAQWDSLANVQFMVLVEQEFGIRFRTEEITSLPTLGALVQLIAKKKG